VKHLPTDKMEDYQVRVIVEGVHRFTWCGRAPREGVAETRAMMSYPYKLNGEHITFENTNYGSK
jgi:hypothetical protein